MEFARTRPAERSFLKYGIPLIAIALLLPLQWLSDSLIGDGPPLVHLLCTVIVVAWYDGLVSGLASTVIFIIICMYFFVNWSQPEQARQGLYRLVVFFVDGVMVSALMESLQTSRRRAEAAVRKMLWQQEALRRSEERLRAIQDSALDCIIAIDQSGRVLEFNPAAAAALGYRREEAIGRVLVDLIAPEPHDGGATRGLAHHLGNSRTAQGQRFEVVARRADGFLFPMEMTIAATHRGGPPISTVFLRDITARKRAEEQLERQATHDALTGLPNRTRLRDGLDESIAAAQAAGASVALLLIDLDRFKEINDTLGHHYGDIVLQQLSPRLRRALRKTDLVSRLGGDEFGIVLPEVDEAGATLTAEKLLGHIVQPIVIEGQTVEVGASIGIALFPNHGQDAITLMRRADVAMYAAKRGRAGHVVYATEQSEGSPRRLAMISELRRGIEEGQFVIHYQPKIALATMVASSAEALVRWKHPNEGLLLPLRFIPLAEHTGLIKSLSLWALEHVLRQCRLWSASGVHLNVAVNLAPSSLQDERLVVAITELLRSSGAQPSSLTLEVTEGAMMADPIRARETLAQLHEMGVRISIDDFGTGYSSLSYLKDLPLDEVKIDQSFVQEMMVNEHAACIVRSVIDLGHNLGLKVVAEGVEDQACLDLLASLGCDYAQGFYFSRPLPAVEFLGWMGGRTRSNGEAPVLATA